MSKSIFVGNFPYETTEEDLKELFLRYGIVDKVRIILDRETGKSRGFGFIKMNQGAEDAIQSLNGSRFNGRPLRVTEAIDKRQNAVARR